MRKNSLLHHVIKEIIDYFSCQLKGKRILCHITLRSTEPEQTTAFEITEYRGFNPEEAKELSPHLNRKVTDHPQRSPLCTNTPPYSLLIPMWLPRKWPTASKPTTSHPKPIGFVYSERLHSQYTEKEIQEATTSLEHYTKLVTLLTALPRGTTPPVNTSEINAAVKSTGSTLANISGAAGRFLIDWF